MHMQGKSTLMDMCAHPVHPVRYILQQLIALTRAPGQSQDVSRLVDVCRQAIIFDDIADITACVTLIASDSDVHLLRAKNRLSCSAAASGGYRDVLLNLCVITGAAQEMGVDRHVCEVQLILRSFFLLKVCLFLR